MSSYALKSTSETVNPSDSSDLKYFPSSESCSHACTVVTRFCTPSCVRRILGLCERYDDGHKLAYPDVTALEHRGQLSQTLRKSNELAARRLDTHLACTQIRRAPAKITPDYRDRGQHLIRHPDRTGLTSFRSPPPPTPSRPLAAPPRPLLKMQPPPRAKAKYLPSCHRTFTRIRADCASHPRPPSTPGSFDS